MKTYLKYLDCKHIECLRTITAKVKGTCPRSYLGENATHPNQVISIKTCNDCCAYAPREDGQLNLRGGVVNERRNPLEVRE